MSTTKQSTTNTQITPEQTPLYIGPGVTLHGKIVHNGEPTDRAVILGNLVGDLEWNGIVQVPKGGVIDASAKIYCRELVVAGTVKGKGVRIEAGLLRLEPTADVQVDEAFLPSGGLEQTRGSFFIGKLNMSPEHPFADDALLEAATKPDNSAALITEKNQDVTSTVTSEPGGKTLTGFSDANFSSKFQEDEDL